MQPSPEVVRRTSEAIEVRCSVLKCLLFNSLFWIGFKQICFILKNLLSNQRQGKVAMNLAIISERRESFP